VGDLFLRNLALRNIYANGKAPKGFSKKDKRHKPEAAHGFMNQKLYSERSFMQRRWMMKSSIYPQLCGPSSSL